MKKPLTLFLLFLCYAFLWAQEKEAYFEQSYALLHAMLNDKVEYNFKDAVFSVENAYMEGKLNAVEFDTQIELYTALCNSLMKSRVLEYEEKDKETVSKWASIFSVMTDSIPVHIQNKRYVYAPFGYDFNDVFGHNSKEPLFVSKLLKTRKGNCRSLPYLYKILAEELGVSAHLALAPNHVYIKHNNKRNGWFNTELTSGIFPIDAWIMASGYVHVNAIINGVYMKALDNKESIALLLVDLAENYNDKYPNNDGSFALHCANRAIEVYPNFAKALILKAEAYKIKWQTEKDPLKKKERLVNLEQQLSHIHNLGYRQMPEEMYLNWLVSLNIERETYENQKLNTLNQN